MSHFRTSRLTSRLGTALKRTARQMRRWGIWTAVALEAIAIVIGLAVKETAPWIIILGPIPVFCMGAFTFNLIAEYPRALKAEIEELKKEIGRLTLVKANREKAEEIFGKLKECVRDLSIGYQRFLTEDYHGRSGFTLRDEIEALLTKIEFFINETKGPDPELYTQLFEWLWGNATDNKKGLVVNLEKKSFEDYFHTPPEIHPDYESIRRKMYELQDIHPSEAPI